MSNGLRRTGLEGNVGVTMRMVNGPLTILADHLLRGSATAPVGQGPDMRTVALITQKGGSGKSTLSASLAVEAQANRETVFIVDMDPQQSLSTWARNRAENRLGTAAIDPDRLAATLDDLSRHHVTLVILDTPASLTDASEAAMQAADLILIPVRPTGFDIWASEATWRRARELGKPFCFVLNQCPITQGSRRLREAAEALEEMGGILQPMITSRVDFQEAILRGLGPTEANPTGPAADEIRQLWASLRRRLARVRLDREAGRRAA